MDNMQKGKKAEKIIEGMFKEAGFKVFKSGYENTFKDLADRNNLIKGPAGKYIRHHPDFIVVDKQNYAYLIEVKFRRYGLINQEDLFNYPETQVILLTKDSMHCQYLKEIHKNGKKFLPLSSMKPFSQISSNILKKYVLKTRRLLGDETLFGQLIEGWSQKVVGKDFIQTYTGANVKFSYVEDYNSAGDVYENTGSKETISSNSGGDKEIKISTSRDKIKWDTNEDNLLKGYYRSKMSINDIAANLGRKNDAVIFRLAKLGLISIKKAIKLVKGKNINRETKRPIKIRRDNDKFKRHYLPKFHWRNRR
jgi:hypothetical protein